MKKFQFILLVVIILLLGFALWRINLFQKPFKESDIPQWKVEEIDQSTWKLQSIDEPQRHTLAWLERRLESRGCDTLIIMGGLEEGKNLAVGGNHLKNRANIVAIRQPINQLIESNLWKDWTLFEWLLLPEILKKEMAHTIGALRAVTHFANYSMRKDLRFSNRVLLSGGSFGAPFPVILTSFNTGSVAALMVIYGFTNYEVVITRDLTRQGLIHFKLEKDYRFFTNPGLWLKAFGVKVLGRVLGFLLGNMLKYGHMELYFPNIKGVPVYFINGQDDHLVPKEAYEPMWESASQPKYQQWVKGDHIRPGEQQEVKRLIEYLAKWAESQKLWACHN